MSASKTTPKQPASAEAIARAAIQCFERFGVGRTSMLDIARESGWSRQTIYRFFPTRTALLEYVAEQRLQTLAQKLNPYFRRVTSLREALIEGSLVSLRVGTSDPVFLELLTGSVENAVARLMAQGSPGIRQLMLDLWGPLLDASRRAGELRTEITNDDAVTWISNVHMMAAMQGGDEFVNRRMFEIFLVRLLVTDAECVRSIPDRATARTD